MGLIKAALSSIGGTLGDQWLESIEPMQMDNQTLMSKGVMARKNDKRNSNTKGSSDLISEGSVIKVGVNETMLMVDGGKIIDYSAEPGYYTVKNDNAPSMFEGGFNGALSDAFQRFKFGGTTPYSQSVVYINTQEIQDIPFGTPTPLSYFDEFYNAELSIRANGYYSIRIANPIKFYTEMASKNAEVMTVDDLRKGSTSEFLTALQTAVGKMSVDGVRISHIKASATDLSEHMSNVLDSNWLERRGIDIVSVGINSISYDDSSQKLIEMRNQGAMLGDPNIRTGYVQGAAARGMEAAGSNPGGAMSGFIGMNTAMNATGGFVAAAGEINNAQAQQQAAQPAQPAKSPSADSWTCTTCNNQNTSGKFCANCGGARPTAKHCTECGSPVADGIKFCSNCGKQQ